VSDAEDFYYRRKPHASIVRRQHMSPEQRNAQGLDWHRRVLNVGNSRTVHRIVRELLEIGDLVRLGDGRLTSPEVQRERAARARTRRKPGEGEGGGGAAGGGQLVLIEGGRSPQKPVENDGDSQGTAGVCPEFGRRF
jgi:hypothetical protein